MNVKAKSHLKHINIKIYSKKKEKKVLIPETPQNIYRYISVMFLVSGGVSKRHISGVLTGTARN